MPSKIRFPTQTTKSYDVTLMLTNTKFGPERWNVELGKNTFCFWTTKICNPTRRPKSNCAFILLNFRCLIKTWLEQHQNLLLLAYCNLSVGLTFQRDFVHGWKKLFRFTWLGTVLHVSLSKYKFFDPTLILLKKLFCMCFLKLYSFLCAVWEH